MEKKYNLERYFEVIIEAGLYSRAERLKFHLEYLFKGIDFSGKRVLDIGGGSGKYSFYAPFKGAVETICIEPEDAGSSSGVISKFNELGSLLDVENVSIETTTFQDFDPGDRQFDIILLHNSINHLDEDACIDLHRDQGAQDIYQGLFDKLNGMATAGAILIVCDCSRNNFYPFIGFPNPIDPGIEWNKHQSPETWSNLLAKSGFSKKSIRWSSLNPLGKVGRVLFGNKLMSYFTTSHFCLTLQNK